MIILSRPTSSTNVRRAAAALFEELLPATEWIQLNCSNSFSLSIRYTPWKHCQRTRHTVGFLAHTLIGQSYLKKISQAVREAIHQPEWVPVGTE